MLWASWISVSKSEIARRPRTIERAPRARQKSTVRPSKVATSTRGDVGRPGVEGGPDDRHPPLGVEEGRLARVAEDGHDDLVEDRGRPADHVEVAVRDGVEGSRIDRDARPLIRPPRRSGDRT